MHARARVRLHTLLRLRFRLEVFHDLDLGRYVFRHASLDSDDLLAYRLFVLLLADATALYDSVPRCVGGRLGGCLGGRVSRCLGGRLGGCRGRRLDRRPGGRLGRCLGGGRGPVSDVVTRGTPGVGGSVPRSPDQ